MQYNGPLVLKQNRATAKASAGLILPFFKGSSIHSVPQKAPGNLLQNNSQTFSFNAQTFGCHDSDEQELLCHDKSGEVLKTQNHSSVVTSRHKEHGDAHFTALLAICGLINPSTASAAPLKIARSLV